jgi:AcrR family transcriptional regulator
VTRTATSGTATSRTGTGGADERKNRIVACAVDVIRERGFARTRVSDIAGAAGTSSGLVLYHFGSLAGVLTEALTHLEETFYDELRRDLAADLGAVDRLRHIAELATGAGPAVGDWTLWLELWVRALRDDDARSARESLDRRWRQALREVIVQGRDDGVFTVRDVATATLRLASLMDGLAIQLVLGEPGVDAARVRKVWLESAAAELGVQPSVLTSRRRVRSGAR